MKTYLISNEDAVRLKHANDLLSANEQVMNVAISRLINNRAKALAVFGDVWKDIKNKYEIREHVPDLYLDIYTNEVKVKEEERGVF